jgi:hypothetical protein
MESKINTYNRLNTWTLSKLPNNKKAIKGRWVYKSKTDQYGNILKFKARWIVKGFLQAYSIDYNKTFSNIYQYESWRLLFNIAASLN